MGSGEQCSCFSSVTPNCTSTSATTQERCSDLCSTSPIVSSAESNQLCNQSVLWGSFFFFPQVCLVFSLVLFFPHYWFSVLLYLLIVSLGDFISGNPVWSEFQACLQRAILSLLQQGLRRKQQWGQSFSGSIIPGQTFPASPASGQIILSSPRHAPPQPAALLAQVLHGNMEEIPFPRYSSHLDVKAKDPRPRLWMMTPAYTTGPACLRVPATYPLPGGLWPLAISFTTLQAQLYFLENAYLGFSLWLSR